MFRKYIAIDLGTANSIVFLRGKGIILSEPSVVAYSKTRKKVIAVGEEAKQMIGKVPDDIIVQRPLRHGVIASFRMTEALIHHMITKCVGRIILFRPEVMISVPSGLTSVEQRAVVEAATAAGAANIHLIPEPIAAAIGAQMPVGTSSGNMIVNMGGGTSEIAVISMNGMVKFLSKKGAGDAINQSIRKYIQKEFKLKIGELMAEKIKIEIGSATKMEKPQTMEVRGNDLDSGQPKTIKLTSNDVIDPIKSILSQIIESVKYVLENTPPELSSDIIDRGIVLSGGTALIRNIDVYFTKALGVSCHVVEDPINAVIRGVSEALENIELFEGSLKAQ